MLPASQCSAAGEFISTSSWLLLSVQTLVIGSLSALSAVLGVPFVNVSVILGCSFVNISVILGCCAPAVAFGLHERHEVM
jgi:hypothetical protein